MPPCVLAPSGHKQSLPVCNEAHRPVGWARKQARVRRRCCGAGGAGGGGREEGGARLVQHALTLLWTPRWRRRWSRTTRRWTRWRRKLGWRRQRTSMAFPITSYRVTIISPGHHVLEFWRTRLIAPRVPAHAMASGKTKRPVPPKDAAPAGGAAAAKKVRPRARRPRRAARSWACSARPSSSA